VLPYAMLHSCRAARRVAAAAAIAVVMASVSPAVVATTLPPTCLPSLRKLHPALLRRLWNNPSTPKASISIVLLRVSNRGRAQV